MNSNQNSTPRISLFNRLSYKQKFLTVSLIFVLAFTGFFPLVSELVTRLQQYGYTELDGTRYLIPVQSLLVDLQVHQLTMHEYLDETVDFSEVEIVQARIEEDLRALEQVQIEYGADLGVQSEFQTIQQRWDALRTDSRQLTDDENTLRHDELTLVIQNLITHVGNRSFLILDPELDTYYMMETVVIKQPAVQEQLNRLAASGTFFIHTEAVTNNEKLLFLNLISQLTSLNESMRSNLQLGLASNASGEMRALVQEPLTVALAANQAVIDEIQVQLEQETTASDFEELLHAKVSTAQKANMTLYNVASEALQQGIQNRIDRYLSRLLTAAGIALFATGFAMVVGIGLMGAISAPLRDLLEAANRLSQGDYSARVPITSMDEAGLVSQTFNKMAQEVEASRTQLETRVAARTRDLELAAEVGRNLTSIRDLKGLLQEAVEVIRNRFNLYYTQVYLTDISGFNLVLQAGTGAVGAQLVGRGHTLVIGPGSINGTAAANLTHVVVPDTTQSLSFLPNPLLPETRSEASIPLVVGKRLVGVLNLQASVPNTLTEDNLAGFEALAGQLAIAIENATLFQEVSQARAEIESEFTRQSQEGWATFFDGTSQKDHVGYTFQEDELLPLTAWEPAPEANAVLRKSISIQDENFGEIHLAFETPDALSHAEKVVDAIAQQVTQQIDSLRLIAQAQAYQAEAQNAVRRLTRESWQEFLETLHYNGRGFVYDQQEVKPLAYTPHTNGTTVEHPILLHGTPVGELVFDGVENWDDETQQLVEEVSRQLSAQLENIRLFEEAERRGLQLETRSKELEASQRVTFAASEVTKLEELFHQVVNLIRDQFDLYHVQVYMVNDADEDAVLRESTGYAGAQLLQRGHHIPLQNTSLVTKAIRTGEAVLVADVNVEESFLANPLLPYTQAELVLPLKASNRTLGALDLQSRRTEQFTPETIALFRQVADQISLIIERTNARLELENLLSLQNATLESSENGILVQDLSGRIVSFNKKFLEMWKISGEKISVQDPVETLSAIVEMVTDREGFLRRINEIYASPEMLAEADLIPLKDGRILERFSMPQQMEDGKIVGRVWSYRDITERKINEEALKISEARLSEAMHIARLGNWEYDVEADLFTFNDTFYSVFHTTSEAMGGYQMSAGEYTARFVHPEDAEVVGTEIGKALAMHERFYSHSLEHRILFPDKSTGYLSVKFSVERDETGNITRFYGANQDVTELKLAEKTLREQQEFLQAVMNNIPESIFWKDENLTYLGCNTAFAKDAGLASPEEIIGKNDEDMPWKDQADLYRADDRLVMDMKEPKLNFEEPQTTPDGSTIWLRTSKVPLKDAADNVYAVLGMYADITERKQAEEALLRLQSAVEQTEDGIALADLNGNLIYSNPAWAKMHGYTPEEIPGNYLSIFHTQEQLEQEVMPFNEKVMSLGSYTAEIGHKRKDGTTFPALQSVTVRKDKNGNPVGMIGTARDITEREEAAQALRESLAIRETLYAGSSRIVRAKTMQDVLLGLVGSTPLQILDRISVLLFDEPWRERRPETMVVAAIWENSPEVSPFPVGTRYPLSQMPFVERVYRDQPTLIDDVFTHEWIDPYSRAAFEKLGTKGILIIPLYVAGDWIGVITSQSKTNIPFSKETLRQIVSLVDQAAAVIQSHRLYDATLKRALELETVAQLGAIATMQTKPGELLQTMTIQTVNRFEHLHADIYLLDESGKTLVLSASAGEAAHLVPNIPVDDPTCLVADVVRTGQGMISTNLPRYAEFIRPLIEAGAQSSLAVPLIAGEKTLGVMAVYAKMLNAFQEEDIRIKSVLAAQIVAAYENARLFTEIQEAAQRLKELDKLKSEFLANMSHELRTPLNSVIGYSEVLLMGLDGELTSEAQTDIQAIYDNGRHLLSLINDVLDLAKIEAGRIVLHKKPESVITLFEQAKTNNMGLLHKLKKPIEIKTEISPNLPSVLVDPTRIVQVIGNLISNAIKYSDKGTVIVRGYPKEEWVNIEVEDQGIGIAPDDLNKVFDQFTQLDMSSTRKVEGTGLGLSITRHLVEMHGGTISVESELGVGSKFIVRLPVTETNGHHKN